ncbi:hypothetical protein L226DRAFT_614789 [Lentinus tigrinus ALCF2SS1-7]|uniref:uncharacterized protein n=1 Tax=Lentinus tigrinus ALCF2SS1-7 TaxID=1328758 RepID=UPI0011661216|nr:hypothetical protein L226DRAFT_614789 [Lentinus tigrinus ALCF2SS1-7]
MSSRAFTRRGKAADSASQDGDSSSIPSKCSSRDRSPSIVFLYVRKSAPPPFNADDADLILHTSAGTPFKVTRSTIRNASSVLDELISRNREVHRRSNNGRYPKCVELTIPESDFVLEALLRFVYFDTPVLFDLDDIIDVLKAATKYKICVAIDGLANNLRMPDFLVKDPLRWPPATHDPESLRWQELHNAVKYRRKISFDAVSLIEDPARLSTLPWDRVPGGKPPCGGACWWPLYADRARPVLHEAPLSDVVCSASFVASVGMELKCVDCRERLLCILLPNGYIEQLKRDIDALPEANHYAW